MHLNLVNLQTAQYVNGKNKCKIDIKMTEKITYLLKTKTL